jgi:hypothetical protein
MFNSQDFYQKQALVPHPDYLDMYIAPYSIIKEEMPNAETEQQCSNK